MTRVEILTGRERRRSWSDEEKLAILSEVASGEGTVTEIARRHDILAPQIYAWRRKFSSGAETTERSEASIFLPVTVVPAVEPVESLGREAVSKQKVASRRTATVEIRCKGGRALKVDVGLAPSVLQALVRAVEGA